MLETLFRPTLIFVHLIQKTFPAMELQHLNDFTGTSGIVLAKRNRHLPVTWEAIFVDHRAVQTCLFLSGKL